MQRLSVIPTENSVTGITGGRDFRHPLRLERRPSAPNPA